MIVELKLATDRQLIDEAVKAHLSTILFHRLFGMISPSSAEAVGVTYPTANNPEADQLIAEKLKELAAELSDNDSTTISIKFYDRKVRKSSWFARTQEVCWEEWNLTATVVPSSESTHASTQTQLQDNLLYIIENMDGKKDHIPPITTTDSTPFPYEVTVSQL